MNESERPRTIEELKKNFEEEWAKREKAEALKNSLRGIAKKGQPKHAESARQKLAEMGEQIESEET